MRAALAAAAARRVPGAALPADRRAPEEAAARGGPREGRGPAGTAGPAAGPLALGRSLSFLARRRLDGLLGRPPALSYRDICARSWTLCPAERVPSPRAIFLDGQLDRIIDDPRYRAPDHDVSFHIRQVSGCE